MLHSIQKYTKSQFRYFLDMGPWAYRTFQISRESPSWCHSSPARASQPLVCVPVISRLLICLSDFHTGWRAGILWDNILLGPRLPIYLYDKLPIATWLQGVNLGKSFWNWHDSGNSGQPWPHGYGFQLPPVRVDRGWSRYESPVKASQVLRLERVKRWSVSRTSFWSWEGMGNPQVWRRTLKQRRISRSSGSGSWSCGYHHGLVPR